MAKRRWIAIAVAVLVGGLTAFVLGTSVYLAWDLTNTAQRFEAGAVTTKAIVTSKEERSKLGSVRGGRSEFEPDYFVTYRFAAADGNEYGKEIHVSPTFFMRAKIGGRTEVRYLPDDPNRSEVEFGSTAASGTRFIIGAVLGIIVIGLLALARLRPRALDG